MATFTAAEFAMPERSAALTATSARVQRRRRITPQAGHALEILGHAIDYLTDEYMEAGGTFCSRDPELQAVQLLMSINRQIYFECPEVPTLKERFLSLLSLKRRPS